MESLSTPKTCTWHLAHDLHVIPWFNQVGQISEGLPRLPTSAPWYFPEQRSKNCQNFSDFLYEKTCSKSNGNGLLTTELRIQRCSNSVVSSWNMFNLQVQKIPNSLNRATCLVRKVDHGRNDTARPADLRNVTLAATKLRNLGKGLKGLDGFEGWERKPTGTCL